MKKLTTLLTIAAVLLCSIAFSQNGPAKQWDARYGGTNSEILHGFVQTEDGGFVLGGYSASLISGDQTQEPRGASDYWIVKTDAAGLKQWDARFGGDHEDYFCALAKTTDGGFLLAGYSYSDLNGDKTQHSQGGTDYWIVKTNGSGIKEWDYRYGGSNQEYLMTIIRTSDGGFLLGGYTDSPLSGDVSQESRGAADYWIVKIDDEGVKEWDARFGGSNLDYLYSVIQTTDGGYLLGGYSVSDASGDKTQDSKGYGDYWVVKTDEDGIKQWDASYGGDDDEGIASLVQTTDGGYLLGGDSWTDINGDKTQPSQGMNDYWIVKTDNSGVKQWDARFGGDNTDYFFSLIQTSEGGYLLCGVSSSGVSGDKSQDCWGGPDFWIVKTDVNGAKQWDARFGGSDEEQSPLVSQTDDGGCLLGGSTYSGLSGDKSQESQGWLDFWILKLSSVTVVSEIAVTSGLSVFPNPTDGIFTLSIKSIDVKTTEARIDVINTLGQIIVSEKTRMNMGTLTRGIQFPEGASDGIYLVRMVVEDHLYSAYVELQR